MPARTPEPTPPTLIIADANPWVRRELGAHLRPLLAPQAVQDARSPSEVLMHIADPQCQILVIDPCMPTVGQTDGIPLLRRICCLRPDLQILVLARNPRHVRCDRGLPGQITHVHPKNVSAAWLCRFIAQAVAVEDAA